MDGSNSESNSSSSTLINHRRSIPKGVDENGKEYKENDKRAKSTMSAISKSSSSGKKILGERNESPDNQQKTPNLDSKSVRNAASFNSNRNSSSKSGQSEENSRPYDPSTNYLSPRPRFLRYKPNRFREIMLLRETEAKEVENNSSETNSAADSVSSCGSLPRFEGVEEVNEFDDEIEEEDQVEDETIFFFRGVLRLLILLFVLVLSTSYIVSMNSPTPSTVVQAEIDLRNGYPILQDHVYEHENQNLGLFEETEESSSELNELVNENEGGEGERIEDAEIQEFINFEEDEEGEDELEISDSDQVFATPAKSVADAVKEDLEAAVVQESHKNGIFEGERDPIGNFIDSHDVGDESVSNGLTKNMENASVLKFVIGLTVVILSSVILSLKFRKGRNGRENDTTLLSTPEPRLEASFPDKEEEEASKATPKVDLLGELEIVEMSTSIRSCSFKNSRVIENDVSSKLPNSSYLVDVQTPSTIDRPSHSDEKKPMKKKKGSQGVDQSGGKNTSITPLRRSSRIRSRVTSP